jgi:DNA polymerase III epsilon subunit-like protein
MLSFGACLAENPSVTFQCLLKPTSLKADPQALKISGFSLENLSREGKSPKLAMREFARWVGEAAGKRDPVFVGLNAGFDWSFINYYFHRYYGSNPFGFAPLDIKALYMGVTGCAWSKSKTSHMCEVLRPKSMGDHDALHDAIAQAELFRLILDRRRIKIREGK